MIGSRATAVYLRDEWMLIGSVKVGERAEGTLSHGRAADVAEADEED